MDGTDHSDWGETMSNSPDKGPIQLLRALWSRVRDTGNDRGGGR